MKKMLKLLLMLAVASLLLLPALALGEAEPLTCTFELDKTTVKMEETIQATWRITGGTPPYTISACFVDESPVTLSGNVAKWTPNPADDTPGSQRFYLTVIDDAGAQHFFRSDVFTLVDEKPLMLTFGDFPKELQNGQRLNIPWSITGGDPPCRLVLIELDNQYGNSGLKYEIGADNSSTDVYVESYEITSPPQQHTLGHTAMDAKGRTVYARTPAFIVVDNNPIAWTFAADTPPVISVGENASVTFSLSGGEPPYSVFGRFACPSGQASSAYFAMENKAQVESNVPITMGGAPNISHVGKDWSYHVTVRDAAGRYQVLKSEKLFDVTTDVAPLVIDSITLDKTNVTVGETVTATLVISGGVPPYTIEHSGSNYIVQGHTVAFTPTAEMVGRIQSFRPEVYDSLGQRTTIQSENFAVVGKAVEVNCTITLDKYQARLDDVIHASWVIDGPVPDRVDAYFSRDWNDKIENIQGNSATFRMNGRDVSHGNISVPEERLTLLLTYGEEVYRFSSKPVTLLWTPAQPMTLSVAIVPEIITLGDSILITAQAEGGVKPYTYYFSATTGAQSGDVVCGGEGNSSGGRFTFIPPYATRWDLTVKAVDSEGRMLAKWLHFHVKETETGNPLSCDIMLDRFRLLPGETVNASWKFSGGTPPYTVTNLLWKYAYTVDEFMYSQTGQDEGNKASFIIPEDVIYGYLHITVKDDAGQTAGFTSPKFDIAALGQEVAFSNKVVLSADRVDIGQPITATCTTTAGSDISDITYHYTWVVVDADGKETHYPDETAAADKTTSTFTPQAGVKGYVMVQASYMIAQEDGKQSVVISTPFAIGKEPLPPERPGDANGDNTVDILDLAAIIDHIVSGTPCQSMANADANGDGTVDILDLVWIIDRIVAG